MKMPNANTAKSKATHKPGPKRASSIPDTMQSEPAESSAMSEKTSSISGSIRSAILQRISDGTYLPGERLKELALAREFKASQAPVREAFRSLESLGVLVSERYHGTFVREVSEQETQQVYQLRGYLEEIAAQLIPPPDLKQHIATIAAFQNEMRAAALGGDMEAYALANVQFHRSIVSLAPNQPLLKVWDSLEIAMRSRMNLQRNRQRLASLAEIHQPIVDALEQGDLTQAGRLLKEHSFSFLQHAH